MDTSYYSSNFHFLISIITAVSIFLYQMDQIEAVSFHPEGLHQFTRMKRSDTNNISSLPNPMNDAIRCGNNETGYICDPENVLSSQSITMLNVIIKNMAEENSKPSETCLEQGDGFIFSVAVVTNIADETDPVRVADQIRDNWNNGKCGNDALLLLVTTIKKIQISTGHFMRNTVHSDCMDKIIMQSQHHIAAQNWSELLFVLLQRFNVIIKHGCEMTDDTSSGTIVAAVVSSTLIGTVLLFFCCCKCHPNKGKGTSIQVAFIGKNSPSYGGADELGHFTEIDGNVMIAQSPGMSKENNSLA